MIPRVTMPIGGWAWAVLGGLALAVLGALALAAGADPSDLLAIERFSPAHFHAW